MPSAEFGQVTNYTTGCRYSNILETANSGEGKRLLLPSLKYVRTEGKLSFLPVEGQREKSKRGDFGSRDVRGVSTVKQPCIRPETCRAAGGKSPSLYVERPKIAKDSCRDLEKKRALSQPCFSL